MSAEEPLELQPVKGNPWQYLESIPGASAVWSVWRDRLRAKYAVFREAFLRAAPEHPAKFFECFNCGCGHEVVRWPDGRVMAECRCNPGRCDAFGVTAEDLAPLELNWSKLGHALCAALGLSTRSVRLGVYNSQQIGSWSAEAVPVILTVQGHQGEFFHALSALVARVGKPFILLAPTSRMLGPSARELLETSGSVFVPLDAYVIFNEDGTLQAATAPDEFFAQVAPGLKEPEEEDEARRALGLIERLESECPMSPPTVSTVFRLYCIEELTIAKIARRCWCSVGTVANRLELIRRKTRVDPKDLRRVSDHLNRIQEDVAAAKAEHRWRRRSES